MFWTAFQVGLLLGAISTVALILRYLGMDSKAAVERCMERRPGALYNEVFKDYLLSGLVHPGSEHSSTPSDVARPATG